MSQTSVSLEEVFKTLEDDHQILKLVLFLRKIAPGRFKHRVKLDFEPIQINIIRSYSKL